MKLSFLIIGSFVFIHAFGQTKEAGMKSRPDTLLKLLELRKEKAIGKQFDQFSFLSGNGNIFSNADLKNKVVFVNFWFETCVPCITEFDALNLLYLKFNTDPGFLFISFTFETPETIESVRKKYDLKFPVISIKREECYRLNQQGGFPTNIILDRNQVIKYINPFGGPVTRKEVNEYFSDTIYPKIITELNGIK